MQQDTQKDSEIADQAVVPVEVERPIANQQKHYARMRGYESCDAVHLRVSINKEVGVTVTRGDRVRKVERYCRTFIRAVNCERSAVRGSLMNSVRVRS